MSEREEVLAKAIAWIAACEGNEDRLSPGERRALLFARALTASRPLILEEAAKVADEMAENEREEKLADKESEGKDYDPYSYGAAFLDGAWVTAQNLAKAIRSLSHDGKAPDKEGDAG